MELMTLEEARGWLRAAVETQGRYFVYNTSASDYCSYVPLASARGDDPRSKTGCLVGTALLLAGREMSDRQGIILNHREHWSLTGEATEYFHKAQVAQDGGSTWGDALYAAEDWAKARTC